MQTLPDYKVDNDPGQCQETQKFPSKTTDIVNSGTDFQHGIAKKKNITQV
jgi:hypothetical protein